MPGSADHSDEQLARLVIRLVGAAVLFVLASGVGLVVSRADEGDAAFAPTVVGSSDSIGPLPGVDIGRYAVSRRAALDVLGAPSVAAASFASYVDEAAARRLAGRAGARVVALLVAAPNGEPRAVTGGLEAVLAAERRRAESERDELVSILKPTTDPDFIAQYRSDIARLERLVARLSTATDLVFGVVVVGEADALRALADDPDVRLVDAGGGTERPPLADIRGLRPEETTRAGDPRSRPDVT